MALSSTWTSPTERVSGEIIDATDWNVDLAQNLLHLRTGMARYTTAAGQSIPNSTITVIDFGTVDYDPQSRVTTGASWRYTADVAGYYRVTAFVRFATTTTWADGEVASLRVLKNGAGLFAFLDYSGAHGSAASYTLSLGGSTTMFLAAGEYIDVRAFQASGAALALEASDNSNYICIERI